MQHQHVPLRRTEWHYFRGPLLLRARGRAVSASAELVQCVCKGGDGVRQLNVPRCLAAHRLLLVARVQKPRTLAAAVQQQDLVMHVYPLLPRGSRAYVPFFFLAAGLPAGGPSEEEFYLRSYEEFWNSTRNSVGKGHCECVVSQFYH